MMFTLNKSIEINLITNKNRKVLIANSYQNLRIKPILTASHERDIQRIRETCRRTDADDLHRHCHCYPRTRPGQQVCGDMFFNLGQRPESWTQFVLQTISFLEDATATIHTC